jgi:hypothetical protein
VVNVWVEAARALAVLLLVLLLIFVVFVAVLKAANPSKAAFKVLKLLAKMVHHILDTLTAIFRRH